MSERPFKLGLVVLAHHLPQQLATLLAALQHPRVNLYLHLDRKSPAAPFHEAFAARGVRDPIWLERHRTAWGGLGIVDAELNALSRARADGCDYVMLISGQDFPLRPVDEIVDFAAANAAKSYLAYYSLPFDRWIAGGKLRTDCYSYQAFGRVFTAVPRESDYQPRGLARQAFNLGLRALTVSKPPRRFPGYLTPYAGEMWLNLSASAIDHVLGFVRAHPDYRDYHEFTAAADELFIQSIVIGTAYAQEHEVVADDLRFLIWPDDSHHPKTLTLDDRDAIFASSDLFARKIRQDQQPELFAQLAKRAETPDFV